MSVSQGRSIQAGLKKGPSKETSTWKGSKSLRMKANNSMYGTGDVVPTRRSSPHSRRSSACITHYCATWYWHVYGGYFSSLKS